MTKTTAERIAECIRLRTQWADHFDQSVFPGDLVKEMNAFVGAGQPSSGSFIFQDPRDYREKKLHYQFATQKSRKTFLRIGASWM